MPDITFIVDGTPHGKGRPRFTKAGHAFTDANTVLYENRIRIACKETMNVNGLKPFEDPVWLIIIATFPVPQSTSKKMREAMLNNDLRPTKKPDIDNIVKSVLDGCNGAAYLDDKQVVSIRAVKRYGAEPKLTVHVGSLEYKNNVEEE